MKQTTNDLGLSKAVPSIALLQKQKTQFGSTPPPIHSYLIMSEPSHMEVPENHPHACVPNPSQLRRSFVYLLQLMIRTVTLGRVSLLLNIYTLVKALAVS